jgi:hypothetical protein
VNDGTRQRIDTLFVGGGEQGLGVVKATNEDARDNEVATAIDGVEDSGAGRATGCIGEDVVTSSQFLLTLDMAGGHQGSSNARRVVGENVGEAAMRVSRNLEIPVANRAMEMAVGGAKDDVARPGAVWAVGMEELDLVGGSSLGAVVDMGTFFRRARLGAGRRRGARRRVVRGHGAAGTYLANMFAINCDHFGGDGVGISIDLDRGKEVCWKHFDDGVIVGTFGVGVGVRVRVDGFQGWKDGIGWGWGRGRWPDRRFWWPY